MKVPPVDEPRSEMRRMARVVVPADVLVDAMRGLASIEIPEGASLVRVGASDGLAVVVLEHPSFPLVPRGKEPPSIVAAFSRVVQRDPVRIERAGRDEHRAEGGPPGGGSFRPGGSSVAALRPGPQEHIVTGP